MGSGARYSDDVASPREESGSEEESEEDSMPGSPLAAQAASFGPRVRPRENDVQ